MDLSSTEGLRKLEEYLSNKDFSSRAHEEAGENETSNRFKTPSPGTHFIRRLQFLKDVLFAETGNRKSVLFQRYLLCPSHVLQHPHRPREKEHDQIFTL